MSAPVANGRSAPVAATKRPRRKRDPQSTREAILEAARQQLAQDGKEGVSVAQVAQRAGVNRGTAYQHFQTREQLIEATAAWVSDKLYRSVFGDPAVAAEPALDSRNIAGITEHLAEFAMENPEIGRVWLFELLSAGAFLWPVYSRSHARSAKERQQMAKRFSREVLRLCLHGTLRPEKYAELEELVRQGNDVAKPRLT